MGDHRGRNRETSVGRFGSISEIEAGASVQLSALALALVLSALLFISSPGSSSGRKPDHRSAAAPVAIEIRRGEHPSDVLLCFHEPSLEGLLSMAGFDAVGDSVIRGSKERIAHGSIVQVGGTAPYFSVSVYPMEAPKRLALGLKMDINRAGQDELAAVPGLTRRRAEKIMQYRSEHGTVRQLEELVEKRVLSAKTMHRIRPFLECAL